MLRRQANYVIPFQHRDMVATKQRSLESFWCCGRRD